MVSAQKNFRYQVFLSFRGDDTRKNIVDVLYNALQDQGIKTFKDDRSLETGEEISEQLVKSINESRLHIIVFSKKYAESSWCLDELVTMMECSKSEDQTAYPLFYDVEPKEVRKQTGAVGLAFEKHAEKEGYGRWKDALTKAACLSGWDFATFDGYHAFIKKVVQDINIKLQHLKFKVDEKLVGMRKRVDDVISSLEIDCDDDVRVVGIKGMGGAGKTTLSKAVFYEIAFKFEGKSFVEKVRERSKSSDLKELQKQVLSDVFYDKEIDVKTDLEGQNLMGMRLPHRKALIVLDDVDDVEQLRALAGDLSWFKPGSRIIITTRNQHILEAHKVNVGVIERLDINKLLLSNEEAVCLLSRYAFGREDPAHGYEQLSDKVVRYAAGLPLTIRFLGSLLCGKSVGVWEDTIDRLKSFPEEKTMEVLELSFNDLAADQKDIFLDIACMLKGEQQDVAIRMLDSCHDHVITGLDALNDKSLITISSDGRLLMHDLTEKMGQNVVRGKHPKDPRMHSRLWIKEEIEDILEDDRGTEVTRSIKLVNTELNACVIVNGVWNMKELRFIHVDSLDPCASLSDYNKFSLPNDLQYLYWRNSPLCCLPPIFHAKKLVHLEMVRSNISELWEGGKTKVLKQLKFLNLKKSHLKTFDIGKTPLLQTLILSECGEFAELHVSREHLNLKFLNLGGCNVRNLDLLEMIPNLQELTLSMKEIKHLPDSICELKRLKSLKLKSCWLLKKLPSQLGMLEELKVLILSGCFKLEDIPSSIGQLKSLECLHLVDMAAKKLPQELGNLTALKELNLEGASLDSLPEGILKLKGLGISGSKQRLQSYNFTSSFTGITNYAASSYV